MAGIVTANKIVFRWVYIILPLAFLVISLILIAIFYSRLPAQVAYHFHDSSPDRWLSRGAFTAWLIIPQLFFTLLAFIVVRLILLSARYWPLDNTILKRILPVMGNLLALPQIIITFVMLDIFLYNAYQIRLIPLWVFAVIIMVLGVVVLGVFFTQIIRLARRQRAKISQE